MEHTGVQVFDTSGQGDAGQLGQEECLVADGCDIKGTVENSILFRGVVVEEGATVRNSIIMQGTHISKNAAITIKYEARFKPDVLFNLNFFISLTYTFSGCILPRSPDGFTRSTMIRTPNTMATQTGNISSRNATLRFQMRPSRWTESI